MIAAAAAAATSGYVLSPYFVFKAKSVWSIWQENGPKSCWFGFTDSEWFDLQQFNEWFETVLIPYIKKFLIDLPKVIIGDNLSSHMSYSIVEKCVQYNIRFVFLHPNSTQIWQPLDVSYFRPLKIHWKVMLLAYKKKTLPKS